VSPETIRTAADLRAGLVVLLANDLGKFANKRPAVWVEPDATPMPTTGDGVHIIIQRHRQPMQPSRSKGASQSQQLMSWVVTIRLYGKDFEAFDSSLEKIRRMFPRRQEVRLPTTADRLPEVTFKLPHLETVNCYQSS
jgi:hypothetical protein